MAAIAKSGVPRDMIEQFLVSHKCIKPGQGLDQAPASVRRQLLTEPQAFGRMVNLWVDQQQQAAEDGQDGQTAPDSGSEPPEDEPADQEAIDRLAAAADQQAGEK